MLWVDLCDKACFAHKFDWLAKRTSTASFSPVKPKTKAVKVLSLTQDKQLYQLLSQGDTRHTL
jgi:hypothetical protein